MSYFTIIISVVSLIIAISSVFINVILWRKVNRPIVTVRLSSGTNSSVTLNIVIENTGNLPAKDIRLIANREDVLNCVNGNLMPRDAQRILFENTMIPILANGKQTINSFHSYGAEMDGRWKSGNLLPITIEYYDINGRSFRESYKLRFASDNAFAFSSWKSSDKI